MKVAVFGGTGFVGKYILKSLKNHEHEIYSLIRNGSESKISDIDGINIIKGDSDMELRLFSLLLYFP